tara:strand:+ start:3372 stop:3893 length:522 start_codon:yes stop_codon:yes gene_type:complete
MQIQELIKKHDVRMEAEPIPSNPNMNDMMAGSGHYLCTITGANGKVQIPYSVGPGIIENWILLSKFSHHKAATREREAGDKSMAAKQKYDTAMEWGRNKYRPEIEDVLNCLASDAASVRNARHFEEWASELGYDEDSRKAEDIYRICEKQAADLEDAIGHQCFEALLWDCERL